jgi:alcohol dehydrogenase class IV
MVGRFEFATADRILFGWGTSTELPEIASRFGRRIFVVTSGSARPEALVSRIAEAVNCVRFAVRGEPAVQQVEAGAALARDSACDLVVAIGGGSVIDAGKAIAALMTNPRPVVDYLEVIGAGRRSSLFLPRLEPARK